MRKPCSLCHSMLPLEAYGRDASRRDGLEVRCKLCRRDYRRATRDYRREYAARHRKAA
jgi:hypothetical protein